MFSLWTKTPPSRNTRENDFKRSARTRLASNYRNATAAASQFGERMIPFEEYIANAWEDYRLLLDGQPPQTEDQKSIFQRVQSLTVGSIEGLNEYIGNMYQGRLRDARLTPPMEQRTRPVGDMTTLGLPEFIRMYSSGNDSDCLIHSFLTSTCSSFRQLSQEDKNTVASNFRRYIFATLPAVERKIEYEKGPDNQRLKQQVPENQKLDYDIALRLTPGHFLNDDDLVLLCTYYGINFVLFSGSGALIPPKQFDNAMYMMYNTGVHFESIAVNRGSGYEYTISNDIYNEIDRQMHPSQNESNVRRNSNGRVTHVRNTRTGQFLPTSDSAFGVAPPAVPRDTSSLEVAAAAVPRGSTTLAVAAPAAPQPANTSETSIHDHIAVIEYFESKLRSEVNPAEILKLRRAIEKLTADLTRLLVTTTPVKGGRYTRKRRHRRTKPKRSRSSIR